MSVPPAPAAVPADGRPWLPAIALGLAVALAYANALAGPFQFDDWWAVAGHPAQASLSAWWQALPGIRPLLKLSYTLNTIVSPGPFGFHLANVGLHAANTLLLWRLARHWLPALVPGLAQREFAAFASALLFALHPAATEAVTYISGRSVSLMALFALATWLAQANARARPMARWPQLATPLCFAAALATRETALLAVPLGGLLYAWCAGWSRRDAVRSLRSQFAVAVLALAAGALTPAYRSFFAWSLDTRDAAGQVLGQLLAHRHLLLHSALGLQANIDPDLRVPARFTPELGATALAIAALLALLLAQRRARPWLAFGGLWYGLQLLPTNSLLPRFDLANDRHLYLALVGPALVVAVVLAGCRWRHAARALLVALVLALATATVTRNRDYRSELALWQATVAASPAKARPRVNLGVARQHAGDLAGAERAYRCALALAPGHRQAAINLAVLATGPVSADRQLCTPP